MRGKIMLYIMRHGKTDWNILHKLQGRTDIPLNDDGRGRTKKTLLDNVTRFEQKALDEIPAMEKRAKALIDEDKTSEATKLLNQYTSDFAGSTRQAWKEMENKFWYWFSMGF